MVDRYSPNSNALNQDFVELLESENLGGNINSLHFWLLDFPGIRSRNPNISGTLSKLALELDVMVGDQPKATNILQKCNFLTQHSFKTRM